MKPKILFISHQWLDPYNKSRTSIGGTTLHLLDIIDSIKDKMECFILYPSIENYMLSICSSNKTYILDTKVGDNLFTTYDKEYKKMLEKVIDDFNIDLVHIHHLIGHHYDLIDVLKEKNIPTITTLHDYFPMCPKVNFLYKDKSYCGIDINLCNSCLDNKIDFDTRRKVVGEILNYSKVNIVPNITVSDNYKKLYDKCNYVVIEHGIDKIKTKYKVKKHKKMNIAFVGVMAHLKGSEVVKKIISTMDKGKYNFYFFGVSGDTFFHINKLNYKYKGEYKRENIGNLLTKNNIDLVVLPTICPETYCYTLSEVISSKIPVIGFNIGAIGNRIEKLSCGWTVPLDSMEEGIKEKIEYLYDNKDEYLKILDNVRKIKVNTKENMCYETNKIYGEILKDINIKKNIDGVENSYKEFNIPQETILKKIYHFIKKHTPYIIKRPIYLMIKALRKE